jgi:hypothetical protein
MVLRWTSVFQVLGCLLLWTSSSVQGSKDDPSTFFGGVDNEAYLEWVSGVQSQGYNAAYFQANTADETMGAAVHWKVDTGNQELLLAVAARATGWLGFGMAEVRRTLEKNYIESSNRIISRLLVQIVRRRVVCEEATW